MVINLTPYAMGEVAITTQYCGPELQAGVTVRLSFIETNKWRQDKTSKPFLLEKKVFTIYDIYRERQRSEALMFIQMLQLITRKHKFMLNSNHG